MSAKRPSTHPNPVRKRLKTRTIESVSKSPDTDSEVANESDSESPVESDSEASESGDDDYRAAERSVSEEETDEDIDATLLEVEEPKIKRPVGRPKGKAGDSANINHVDGFLEKFLEAFEPRSNGKGASKPFQGPRNAVRLKILELSLQAKAIRATEGLQERCLGRLEALQTRVEALEATMLRILNIVAQD